LTINFNNPPFLRINLNHILSKKLSENKIKMKARIEKKCIKKNLNPSYFHTMLSVKNVKDNM
jgi:hypothetical protein